MSTTTLERPETKSESKTSKNYKFKLLSGQYVEIVGYTEQSDGRGGMVKIPIFKTHQANKRQDHFPVIETNEDLMQFNGLSPNMKKFERVYGETPVTMTDPTQRAPGETIHSYLQRLQDFTKVMKEKAEASVKALDTMIIEDLIRVAEEEEIDLGSAKTPDDARKLIKAALKSGGK